eukprot:scaffold1307_cov200-Pinguiococcus_pyrenoidosus.AAC.22
MEGLRDAAASAKRRARGGAAALWRRSARAFPTSAEGPFTKRFVRRYARFSSGCSRVGKGKEDGREACKVGIGPRPRRRPNRDWNRKQ